MLFWSLTLVREVLDLVSEVVSPIMPCFAGERLDDSGESAVSANKNSEVALQLEEPEGIEYIAMRLGPSNPRLTPT